MSTPESWADRESLAEGIVPLVGRLHRENKVVPTVYGRSLVHKSVTQIIKAHRFARRIDGEELPLEDTTRLLEAMSGLNLGSCWSASPTSPRSSRATPSAPRSGSPSSTWCSWW